MKKILLLSYLFLQFNCLEAQINKKNNWIASPDKANTQINIFNLQNGELVKSIFLGEKIRYSQFNEEENKLFIITKNFLFITDLTGFETEKKALFSTLAIGITKKGNIVYYGGPFADFEKRTITYIFQSIMTPDRHIHRMTEPHMGVFFDEKLYIPLLDGGLKVITGDSHESKSFNQTLDTAILNGYLNSHPDQPVELSIQAFGDLVLTNIYEGRLKSVNLYNTKTRQIELLEPYLFKFEQPSIMPVACYHTNQLYYVKYSPINNETVAPVKPEYPQEPDYSAMNPKDVKKAEKEYYAKQLKYENELSVYEQAYGIYTSPEHNMAHIYSDIKGIKEIIQIPQAKHLYVDGDLLIAIKENNIDVIDIKTGQIKLTITPPAQ